MLPLIKKRMPSGGKREGAGRKNKYGEETTIVNFKVPASKKEIFRKQASALLKKWEVKKKSGA